jgi:hypothetical protein
MLLALILASKQTVLSRDFAARLHEESSWRLDESFSEKSQPTFTKGEAKFKFSD